MEIKFLLIIILIHFGCQSENCKNLSKKDIEKNTKSENEFESGNILEAFRLTEEAIIFNSENFIAISNRAVSQYNLCLKKGSLSQSEKKLIISDFKQSIKICPKFSKAYRNLIRIAYDFKEYKTVIEYAEEYNRRFKKSSELLAVLGDAYCEESQFEKGIQIINEAIEIEPVYDFAYIVRGKCYTELRKFDKAIEDFNEAIKRDSTFSLAYSERGYCFKMKKNYEYARRDYFKCLEVDSLKKEPYYSLGVIEIERGDTVRGCEYYQLALSNFEKDTSLVKSKKWGELIKSQQRKHCK